MNKALEKFKEAMLKDRELHLEAEKLDALEEALYQKVYTLNHKLEEFKKRGYKEDGMGNKYSEKYGKVSNISEKFIHGEILDTEACDALTEIELEITENIKEYSEFEKVTKEREKIMSDIEKVAAKILAYRDKHFHESSRPNFDEAFVKYLKSLQPE